MGYSTEFIEKVRTASNIIREASEYLDLRKNENAKNFSADCPYCGAKASFNEEKNFFKCFGNDCIYKGDIFGFIQIHRKMSFAEAVMYLAEKNNVPIEKVKKRGVTPFGKIEAIKKNNVSFFPNSFQTPNAYIDELCYLLTPEEFKVLMFIIRQILGFIGKRELHQDNISISQIEHGITKRNGEKINNGVGLSRPTIVKCLKALYKFGIIHKVGPASKDGQLIALNLDGDTFDWRAMNKRHTDKEIFERRVQKKREKSKIRQSTG